MQKFLKELKENPMGKSILTHYQFLEPRPAQCGQMNVPLPEVITEALTATGITRLYSHQANALNILQEGKNLVVATPTSSGKSLIYYLHTIRLLLSNPEARALYLFPIKALAQDQLQSIRTLFGHFPSGTSLNVGIFDGDTKQGERKKLKQFPPQILISNPDMLHLSFLSYNHQWHDFLTRLRLVVLDEIHTYRGIFGSHVSQVLRRLLRIMEKHGIDPQLIFLSATITNPKELAETLSGRDFQSIEESGAPRAPQHFFFMNSPEMSTTSLASRLMVKAMSRGLKTIVFTRSRHATEIIHLGIRQTKPEFGNLVSSYRAGYLPEERRHIEQQLMNGTIKGVVSTSALEMGIDIGGLDVCILAGYPGTVINTWQRGGRVGRGGQESAILLLAQADALDQYIVSHPHDFFGRPFEAAVVDPYNPEIFKAHLPCAAAELPLRATEPVFDSKKYLDVRNMLVGEGKLLPGADGDEWFSTQRFPQRKVDIRGIGEGYSIVTRIKTKNGKPKWRNLGKSDGHRALRECYPGAIYLHRGRQYMVKNLDLKRRNIEVERNTVNYFTRVLAEKETQILEVLSTKPVANFVARLGRLRVTETITGYEKRRLRGQELLGVHPLDLPSQSFETVGLWFEIERVIQQTIEAKKLHFMGGIHAIEHAAISMFPLFALCDRNDIGGISYPFHEEVGKSAVFIYDGHPGGVGLSVRGYEVLEDLLQRTLKLVRNCPCKIGCPSCIHSPKCGAGNKPLDKAAAILCLEFLLGEKLLGVPKKVGKTKLKRNGVRKTMPKPSIPDVAFFDLETQRLAEEVGGWGNKHLMRVSVAVVYDNKKAEYLVFEEKQTEELVSTLKRFDLVVGFNTKNFDYMVIQPYTPFPLKNLPSFDILHYIYRKYDFRVSLDHLARHTLGKSKMADGIQAVEWFRSGQIEKLTKYCKKDVEITKRLFEFGQKNGHLLIKRNRGRLQKLTVNWAWANILPKT